MEATRQASTRATELLEGATNNWNDIIHDKKYNFIPSTTQPSQDSSVPATIPSSLQKTDKETSPKREREIERLDSKKARPPTEAKAGHKNKPRRQKTQPPKKIASKAKSEVNPRLRAGYGSLVSARTSREVHVRQEALDADISSLGLFTKKITLMTRFKRQLTMALNTDPTYTETTRADGARVLDEVNTFKRANMNAMQSDFRRLRGTRWPTNSIIDMFLQTSVQEVIPQTHCYTSHFFRQVLLVSDDNVIYDYREVVDWSDHIEGGMFNLEQLFVPINITNTHWIFTRVHFESKTIKIYDSFVSPNHHYQKYLWAMRSYLYNKEFKDIVPEACPNFDNWKRTWEIQDKSRDLPRQENTYICGLITMILIYLMSRGVQLQRSSYDQFGVSSR